MDYIETELEINIPTSDGFGFDSIVLSREYKKEEADRDDNLMMSVGEYLSGERYVLVWMSGFLRHFTNELSVVLGDVEFRFEGREISDISDIVSLLGSENWKLISGYLNSGCLGDSFGLAYHVDLDDVCECFKKNPA